MKFGCSSRGLFHFIFIASIKSNQEIGWWRKPQEKFEDTKGIIRSSKSNGQKKNETKMTFLDITTILSDRIMTTDYDICCKSRQTSKYVHIKLHSSMMKP
jgi:hypothetical protein